MTDDDKKCCEIEDDNHSQVVKEEVVESCIIDDPDMEIQVKSRNMKSPPKVAMANEVTFLSQMTLSSPPANYATTSANIINTLPQVQTMNRNILRQTLTKTEAKIKEYF